MFTRLVVLAFAYFAAGWLGLRVPYAGSHITLIWLPTGIAVAGLVRWGPQMWPAIALGAFGVNLTVSQEPLLAAGIAFGNTLAPWLTARLLRRMRFDPGFALRRNVARFVGATCLGMLVSASGGVVCLELAGVLPHVALASSWMAWWMGDVVGVLVAAPSLLALTRPNIAELLNRRREACAWLVVSCVVGWFAFGHDYGAPNRSLPMAFLTLPLVAWAAMRLHRLGGALAGLGLSLAAAIGTGTGHGTFYVSDVHIGLFLLWSYMAVTVLTCLIISAMQIEREHVESTLRHSEERLNDAQQVANLGSFDWDVRHNKLWWSDQHWRLWGMEPGEGAPSYEAFVQRIHDDDRPGAEAAIRQAMADKSSFLSEYRVLWSDGSVHVMRSMGRAVLDAEGRMTRMIGTVQDITVHRRASAEVRRSETKFRTLYDSISDAVTLLGEDGIVECNQAALDLFGCATKEQFFQCHPGKELSPPRQADGSDSAEMAERHLAQALREGSARFEWLHKRLDNGVVFPAEVWLSRMELDGRSLVQGVVRDITERKEAERKIQSLAFYDELTKLPNRRLATDRLSQALTSSRRSREVGAIMMLDLDNFKYLNDSQGHDAGDKLLIEAARRLQACVRQEDTVSRFGGDEFVVLLETMGGDAAQAATRAELVAGKILTAFERPFELVGGTVHHRSTCSIGVTLFQGQELLTIDELLKQADLALYQAKGAGRNTVRFFNPQMQSVIESYSAMEAAMHHGLHNNEFRLFYQPQLDQSGRLIGAEALLRWFPHADHPVSPAQFIPLAEETGLIVPIGLWVIQAACAQLKTWSAHPSTRELVLAINVSARQFRQPNFVSVIRDALAHFEVDPRLLKLELTESVVLDNVDEVIDRMMQIKALGVTFALDDFGTGFSSLSYLKRLPLDQVKIDQSFVRDITTDPSDAAIVRAIVAMSHSLGMEVIAEGVETRAQLDFLTAHGCGRYQGYLFGKPMGIEDWQRLEPGHFATHFQRGDATQASALNS